MKKFTFTLERVRQWRENQVAIEQARVDELISQKSLVESRRLLLEREANDSAALVNRTTAGATELRAIDAFRRYVIQQRSVLAASAADFEKRISEQRIKLMEARRRFELLDKLKEKKLTEWNRELAREIELQASELFLAKWLSSQR